MLVERGEARVYDFATNDVPGATDRDRGYWRDVGTLDAYYDAHMDLISVSPIFNLYNQEWPIHTLAGSAAAGEVRVRRGRPSRPRARLDGLRRRRSLGRRPRGARSCRPGVHLHSYAEVEDSILMHGVDVGRGAVVRRAILDKDVRIAPDATDRGRPGGRPGAVQGVGRRDRRDPEGRGRRLRVCAAYPRVPARRLRRRGRARRIPRARALAGSRT